MAIILVTVSLPLTSCSDDNNEPENEETSEGKAISCNFEGASEPNQIFFPYEEATTVNVKKESDDINVFYTELYDEKISEWKGVYPAFYFNFSIDGDLTVGKNLKVESIAFANPYDITGYCPSLCDNEPTGICKIKNMQKNKITLEFKNFKFVRQYSTGGFQKYKAQNMTINGDITYTVSQD